MGEDRGAGKEARASAPQDMEKFAEGVAGMAQRAAELLRGAGDASQAATLQSLAMLARETQMNARDLASGAEQARLAPLVEAVAKAVKGDSAAWEPAMAELAQVALSKERPVWFACALLSSLGVEPESLGATATSSPCAPCGARCSTGRAWRPRPPAPPSRAEPSRRPFAGSSAAEATENRRRQLPAAKRSNARQPIPFSSQAARGGEVAGCDEARRSHRRCAAA